MPGFTEQQRETDSDQFEDAFKSRGEEAEEETEDVAEEEEEELEPVSVANRILTIESSIPSSATAAGSVEATPHHADEEGNSEIRAYDVKKFLDLNNIFDDVEVPVLAIDPDKVERIKPAATKTAGKKKFRLKRGITMDTRAHTTT